MNWLSLIGGILSLVNSLIGYLRERKLIEGAVAEVLLQNANDSLDVIAKARTARQAVRDDLAKHPERVRDDDGYKRQD
jgi:hypothetical protein